MIPRMHLVEVGDHEGAPALLRDLLTDTLQFGTTRFGFFDPVVDRLAGLLRHMRTGQVVDLCSGATGPWFALADALRAEGTPDLQVTFTDHHVNVRARAEVERRADPSLVYWPTPVDATAVPAELPGVRTLFSAFHHFRPDDARRVLASAREARAAIAVFEVTERTVASCAVACAVPLGMWLTTPLMRPLTWQRLALTYALPVLPVCNLWDGVVSSLRTYTEDELRELVSDLGGDGYRWEVGRITPPGLAPPVTWLIGAPDPP